MWRFIQKRPDSVACFPKEAWQCGVFVKRGLTIWRVFQKKPDNMVSLHVETAPLQGQSPHYRGSNNVQATCIVRPLQRAAYRVA